MYYFLNGHCLKGTLMVAFQGSVHFRIFFKCSIYCVYCSGLSDQCVLGKLNSSTLRQQIKPKAHIGVYPYKAGNPSQSLF